MKRYLPLLSALLVIVMSAAYINNACAQSQGIKEAFENVKESLDDLATAKDDQRSMELSLRIETLKKVLELSIAEAKDMRVKLLELENLEDNEEAWRISITDAMKDAIDYFKSKEQYIIDNEKTLAIDDVKTIANELKAWRNKYYLPKFSEARDYFLIQQQNKTIETARKRWQKINADVQKLEKAKVRGIKEARTMLGAAHALINEGLSLNEEARANFFTMFIESREKATSTLNASTSVIIEFPLLDATSTEAVATSTDISTSTISSESQTTTTSIRDMVKESLSKIRDAYNIYIDMSTLVRKLLK